MDRRRNKTLEKTVKGFANHRRIEILELLEKTPELTVFDIAGTLGINFRTASEHTKKLAGSDLIMKRYEGTAVRHRITTTGIAVLKFLRALG
jgi:DNA-binding transcriptional ArsR family regulator